MKKETTSNDPLRRVFGGALMLAGTVTLIVSPAIVGSNTIPEGVLVFGIVSMLGGWATMLAGQEKPEKGVQPSMGD